MNDTIDDPRQVDWLDEVQRERDQELARKCLKPRAQATQTTKGGRKHEPRRADA